MLRRLRTGAVSLWRSSCWQYRPRPREYATAQMHFEEGLSIFREIGDKWSIANSLVHGQSCVRPGRDYPRPIALRAGPLATFKEVGVEGASPMRSPVWRCCFHNGGITKAGEIAPARKPCHAKRAGEPTRYYECLEGLAVGRGLAARRSMAATLFGAYDASDAAITSPLQPAYKTEHDRIIEQLQAQVDPSAWTPPGRAGRAMSLDEAADYALQASSRI